jgi:hypothetical protein
MFGHTKKKRSFPEFLHSPDCKIVKADPSTEIKWSEIRTAVWEARCVCGVQYHYEQQPDRRVRLDPRDPSTSRHMPQCQHRDTTDPVLLRAFLSVRDTGDYWLVTCGFCETFWQVPYYAEASG